MIGGVLTKGKRNNGMMEVNITGWFISYWKKKRFQIQNVNHQQKMKLQFYLSRVADVEALESFINFCLFSSLVPDILLYFPFEKNAGINLENNIGEIKKKNGTSPSACFENGGKVINNKMFELWTILIIEDSPWALVDICSREKSICQSKREV